MSRSMRSTISPVRRRRSISNSIRCRRRRPACGDPEIHPQPETYWGRVNPIGFRACYDEGKRCAETLFFDYHRQHSIEIKVVRIFNTYGPRMHPNDGRVVSNLVVQALKGEDITIYGDGSQTRAFCYVDDLIEAILRMMATDAKFTGPLNIGNPGEFSMRELADLVVELTGTKSKIVLGRSRPTIRNSVGRTYLSLRRCWAGSQALLCVKGSA